MANHTFGDPTFVTAKSTFTRCVCGEQVRKMANDVDSEQLLMAEAITLGTLKEKLDDKYLPFLPELVSVSSELGARWATTFSWLDGFYSLAQVHEKFPALEPRDAAWMFRRLLYILAAAHEAGVAHGDPSLHHVMIHPEKHGLVLLDWSVACPEGDTDDFRIDLGDAATTMILLLGGTDDELPAALPRQYHAYFGALAKGSVIEASVALTAFDDLITHLYGKRTFRPFSMEAAVT